MKAASPYRRCCWWWLAGAMGVFLLATLLDRPAYESFVHSRVYAHDWGWMFRVAGYVPLWILLGLALALADPDRRRRGVWLVLAVALAGGVAEGAKLVIRRERPEAHAGAYHFRSYSDRLWSTRNLGLPSSHTAVAFAAATVLTCYFRRAGVVWFLFAVGCAATRVLDRAHFVSDVALGAVVGVVVGWMVVRWGSEDG